MFRSIVRRVRSLRPSLESLEGRALLSAFHLAPVHHELPHHHCHVAPTPTPTPPSNQIIVNTVPDDPSGPADGQTTLRDAINLANAAPSTSKTIIEIGFSGNIDLKSQLPALTGNMTIEPEGNYPVTIEYGASYLTSLDAPPIFTVDGTVQISGIDIYGRFQPGIPVSPGEGGNGPGIINSGTLTCINDTFSQCVAWSSAGGPFNGGGIANLSPGVATITNCEFSQCNSTNDGGAIYNNGSIIVSGTSFSDCGLQIGTWGGPANLNVFGGAIYNSGTMTLTISNFSACDSEYGGAVSNTGNAVIDASTLANLATQTGALYNTGTIN